MRPAAMGFVRGMGRNFRTVAQGAGMDMAEGQDELEGERDQRHPTAKPAMPPKPAHWLKTHAQTAFPGICNIITIAAVKTSSCGGC
jgi:hypothetical protein